MKHAGCSPEGIALVLKGPALYLYIALRFWIDSLLFPVYLAVVSALFLVATLVVQFHSTRAKRRKPKFPPPGFVPDEHEDGLGMSPVLLLRGWGTLILEASRVVSCATLCILSIVAATRVRSGSGSEVVAAWKIELAQCLYYVSLPVTIYYLGRSSLC